MKSSGFTLIELMMVIAIFGILIAVGVGACTGPQARARPDYKCVDGYKCTFDGGQILDENRGGIRCFD